MLASMRSIVVALLALFSLACVGLAATPHVSAGACAMPQLWVRIAPPVAHAIPSDQGILLEVGTDPRRAIGTGPAPYSGATEITAAARLTREGETDIALRLEQLAPSLARLVPSTAPSAGRWRVVTDTHTEEVTFGAQPARGTGPAAPQLVSVSRTQQSIPGPRGTDSYLSVQARLRGALPASVAGVVLFQVRGETERAALTQSRQSIQSLSTRGGQLVLFSSGGRCSVSLPGQDPQVRGPVRLAAYDLDGRVGARSRDVTVTSD